MSEAAKQADVFSPLSEPGTGAPHVLNTPLLLLQLLLAELLLLLLLMLLLLLLLLLLPPLLLRRLRHSRGVLLLLPLPGLPLRLRRRRRRRRWSPHLPVGLSEFRRILPSEWQ
jgi:hypothetical protein